MQSIGHLKRQGPRSIFVWLDFRRSVRKCRTLLDPISKKLNDRLLPDAKNEFYPNQPSTTEHQKNDSYVDQQHQQQPSLLIGHSEREVALLTNPTTELDTTRLSYLVERNQATAQVMQTYKQRLDHMTKWRRDHEERLSRRKLALPFSLTGFGDCSQMTRFWTQRIRSEMQKIVRDKQRSPYLDSLSPILIQMFESHPDQIESVYRPVYERYLEEKRKFDRQQTEFNQAKQSRSLQMPFNFVETLRKASQVQEYESEDALIKDEDYDNYLKHHHLLQFIANRFQKAAGFQYDGEIEAFTNSMWQRDYGHPNPETPPSHIPCGGCGANLHCMDTGIPGYLPSEKFEQMKSKELRESLCQRCDFLRLFNVSLNVSVKEDDYDCIISSLKDKSGLVILMVDLLDFPSSINPKIFDLIGTKRKIYIVGNKVDLLPRDGDGFLDRIKQSLLNNLKFENRVPLQNVMLISAKTGFGVEDLITNLFNDWNGRGDVYLVGCTNVGKSTLFNSLLQSDLCNLRQNDIIQRATTSVWPGTTLNLLKFPLRRVEGWQLQLRMDRLRYSQLRKHRDEIALRNMSGKFQDRNVRISMLEDRISSTFRKELPYRFESGHPLSHKLRPSRPFDAQHPAFKNANFFHDTPGTVYKQQILTLLTTEELLKTIPRKEIEPRTFTLHPYQSLFVGGLSRLDLISCKRKILVTVFASNYLPVHICFLEQADRFYEYFLGTDMLAVPMGDQQRLKCWPQLVGRRFYLSNSTQSEGFLKQASIADVVFSSAGWAAITLEPDDECVIKAHTPEGRGLFLRTPAVLPYAVRLRGKKITGTPCFEKHRPFYHPLGEDNYSIRKLKLEHSQEPHVTKQLKFNQSEEDRLLRIKG